MIWGQVLGPHKVQVRLHAWRNRFTPRAQGGTGAGWEGGGPRLPATWAASARAQGYPRGASLVNEEVLPPVPVDEIKRVQVLCCQDNLACVESCVGLTDGDIRGGDG